MNSQGEQLTSIVRYICNLAEENHIVEKNLWLENLAPNIYLKDLKNKYKESKENTRINVVLGEYDDPYNQKQNLVNFDLLEKDNLVIYGNAESGKETLLSTFIYDLITTYTSDQVQLYILDFGSEALKIYKNAPHVGDVVFMGEDDKLDKFFEMIQKEIKTRKSILSDYNGDYNNYISKGKSMPLQIVIVNNYEVFEENYDLVYDDIFLTLTREGAKFGILFILTASAAGGIKYRLTQNFNRKIALQLNNEDDFNIILENVGKLRPSHFFGRGLTSIDSKVYEFQTARICNTVDYNKYIEETIKKLQEKNKTKANPIPVLPEVLRLQDVGRQLKSIEKLPIGVSKKDLEIYFFNFIKKFMTVIGAKNMKDAIEYIQFIVHEAQQLKNVQVKILDAEEIRKEKKEDLKGAFNELLNDIEQNSNNSDKFKLYVIIGIEKFITEEFFDSIRFNDVLNKAKESDRIGFIINDNAERLKAHSFEDWYQYYIGTNNGIWVGNGIENQTLIALNFNINGLKNKCGRSFGYVITEGETSLIKLIGMKETGDEDE